MPTLAVHGVSAREKSSEQHADAATGGSIPFRLAAIDPVSLPELFAEVVFPIVFRGIPTDVTPSLLAEKVFVSLDFCYFYWVSLDSCSFHFRNFP